MTNFYHLVFFLYYNYESNALFQHYFIIFLTNFTLVIFIVLFTFIYIKNLNVSLYVK